jgi:leader peptidase (prepilin peptidase)/N-methyltransferase
MEADGLSIHIQETWILIAVLLGWGMAVAINHLADRLTGENQSAGLAIIPCLWYRKRGIRSSLRPLLIELSMPLLFAVTILRFGITVQAAVTASHLSVLVLLSVVDWTTRRIPNIVVLPASAAAVFLAAAGTSPGLWRSLGGGALALGMFLLAYLLGHLFLRLAGPQAAKSGPALGFGDVKLALFIGLATGYPAAMTALLMGTLIGAVAALGQILWTFIRQGRYQPFAAMAYGPYLALGAAIALLWGSSLY